MYVFSYQYRWKKNSVVLNGIQITIPYHENGITLRHVSGHQVRFTIDDSLDILWDGFLYLELKLPHKFRNKVFYCSIASSPVCRNYAL